MIVFYDVETFKNFTSIVAITEYGERLVWVKYAKANRDDFPYFIEWLLGFEERDEELTLVGYNSLAFDDVILKVLLHHPEFNSMQFYKTAQLLIEADHPRELSDKLREIYYEKPFWFSVDLMKLLEENQNRPSLKHCSIHLQHPLLQDLPLAFDATVLPKHVPTIEKYNINDVEITERIYRLPKILEAIQLRLALGEMYDVDLRSAGDSKIANVIFEARYGIPEVRGTKRPIIYGSDLIPPTLKFNTKTMQNILDVLNSIVLFDFNGKHYVWNKSDLDNIPTTDEISEEELVSLNDKIQEYFEEEDSLIDDDGYLISTKKLKKSLKKFNHKFTFNGIDFVMGQGGLHSDDKPRILESDDKYIIRDADVGSYYPNLILHYELVPAHLDKIRFLEVYREIVRERLEGKYSGDKVKADGLKIAINGAFGKLNFAYFWLYDPLQFYRVTLYGQLLLLMLIEMLYEHGINCVSANTDGIVCKVPRNKEDVYFDVCQDWQSTTGMNLEYTDYEKLVQLNVNSYMSIAVREGAHSSDGSIVWKDKVSVKSKKDFDPNLYLQKQTFKKGYSAPIIAMALQAYFTDGIKPEEFVMSQDNIHLFCYTQRTGKAFNLYWGDEKLQKTNRFYVANVDGKPLSKKAKGVVEQERNIWLDIPDKEDNRILGILKGERVWVANNIVDNMPKPDYNFYVGKIRGIINDIRPPIKQKTIFDMI